MIEVAGRSYHVPSGGPPRVAICLDGSDPAYFASEELRLLPTLARWTREATHRTARGAFPTFTNPNNVSIITGAPPAVHGIAGNHFFDGERDVPMNERRFIRGPTILESLARAGCRVLAVTAKDKLTKLIDPGSPG